MSPRQRTPTRTGSKSLEAGDGNHPLLGWHFTSPHPAGTHFWETTLDRKSLPYLDDHRIQGVAVLPASTYLEMALAAAGEVFGAQSVALQDVEFRKALFLPEGGTHAIQVILSQGADGAASFHIYSRAAGVAHRQIMDTACDRQDLSATGRQHRHPGCRAGDACGDRERDARRQISGEDYYRRLGENGIHYGPFFQSIARLWRNDGEVLAEVQVPDGPEADFNGWQIHPAILDAGLQVFGAAVAAEATENDRQGNLPADPHRPVPGHTVVQAVISGVTLGCGIGRRMPRRETCSFSMKHGHVAVEIQGLRFEYLSEDTQRAAVR